MDSQGVVHMRRWNYVVAGLLIVMGVPLSVAADQGAVEERFAPGQRVRMDLSAGEYTIRAGRDDRIRVEWDTRDDESRRARVDIVARGSEATIVTRGPKHRFRVTIELPARTDITTRLSAGELRIRGISGDKDIRSLAGEVDIDVVRADDYGPVSAQVTAGELSARPFGVAKGGLFRSFSMRGPGRFSLRVRLMAGEIRLRQ